MGVLILPSRSLWKPPLGVQIDWGHSLAAKLVRCYLLNENAGLSAFDLVHPKNRGTITGALWRPSISGSGLYFDGGDDVQAATTGFSSTTSFSAAVLFSTTFASPVGTLIGCGDDTVNTNNMGWHLQFNANKLLFGIEKYATVWYYAWGVTAINDSKPHLGFITYDGVTKAMRVYLDGKLEGTQTNGEAQSAQVRNLGLGIFTRQGTSGNYTGSLASAWVWERVLSQSEVQWLYAEPYCFLQPVIRRFYSIPEEIKVMNRIYRPVKQQSPTIPVRQLGI